MTSPLRAKTGIPDIVREDAGMPVRFVVSRTSSSQSQPCPEAKRGTVRVWDRRTFASPEEHDARSREKWHERGTDHGYWDGADGTKGIKRRLPDREAWYVEFSTLDELIAFVDRHGDVVLSPGVEDEARHLEIYDDYRE